MSMVSSIEGLPPGLRPWKEGKSLLEAFPVDAIDKPLDYVAEGGLAPRSSPPTRA